LTEFIEKPSPNITITDASSADLHLGCFNLIILVEPDPETWMHQPGTEEVWGKIIDNHNEAISEELDPDSEIQFNNLNQEFYNPTMLLLRYADANNFYDYLVEFFFVDATFHLTD